jgi:hypothetical protein
VFEILQSKHETKSRLLTEMGKRRMRKDAATSMIAPPKEHLIPDTQSGLV